MLDILLLPQLVKSEQNSGIVIRGGGSAANTAAWLAKLEQPARFVGCSGGDTVGRVLVDELRASGVDTFVRTVDGEETGCVAVEVTGDGERVMRSSRGANRALSPRDIRESAHPDVSWVHLTGYALLGPYGLEILEASTDVARCTQSQVSFDPSSVRLIEAIGARRLLDALVECGVTVCLPNALEAEALTATRGVTAAAEALIDVFPMIAIKQGPDGATCGAAGRFESIPTHSRVPLDTTGAGDAFNAGIIAGLVQGRTLSDACAIAHSVGAVVIKQYGGRPQRLAQQEADS